MIEIGTVIEHRDQGVVLVGFDHLATQAGCAVLQPTTGANTIYRMPSVGTQVVCWLESGKNIALGAVFSDAEPVPEDANEEGLYVQLGTVEVIIKDGKATLKNDTTDLKTLFKDILALVQNITVSTSIGPSGTPLPPTITAIKQLDRKVENLLK